MDGKLCIGDALLRKYIPKYIKPISSKNNITCECETFISVMLLKSDINKWRLSQLAKLYKLYNNSALTRLYQISKIYFIQYKNEIFINILYIHSISCDDVSSYHCASPIIG